MAGSISPTQNVSVPWPPRSSTVDRVSAAASMICDVDRAPALADLGRGLTRARAASAAPVPGDAVAGDRLDGRCRPRRPSACRIRRRTSRPRQATSHDRRRSWLQPTPTPVHGATVATAAAGPLGGPQRYEAARPLIRRISPRGMKPDVVTKRLVLQPGHGQGPAPGGVPQALARPRRPPTATPRPGSAVGHVRAPADLDELRAGQPRAQGGGLHAGAPQLLVERLA